MKKAIFILGLGILILGSSCKKINQMFGKSSMSEEEITALIQENKKLKNDLNNCAENYEAEKAAMRSDYENQLLALQEQLNSGKVKEYNVYYVVVGSFKNMKYAEDYAGKIKAMGYEGKIIDGPNNFNLVTSGTFKTLKSSLEPMRQARTTLSSEAWIYFKN
jgi:cell division protein FtsN